MQRPRTTVVVSTALALVSAPLLLAGCVVPSPSPGNDASLDAVAAINAGNAWAIGTFRDQTGRHELMEHWNGKSWQEVSLPPPIGTGLSAITAVSGSNVWAVSNVRTLHFNGSSWRSIPNPPRAGLYDVASASDGAVYGLAKTDSGPTLLTMTASGWRTESVIPMPVSISNCNAGSAQPKALAVVRAADVWIIGNKFGAGSDAKKVCPYSFHWNGLDWREQPMSQFDDKQELSAVSANGDDDVWAVGTNNGFDTFDGGALDHGMVMHWDGRMWGTIPAGFGALNDVDATAGGIWAVGVQGLSQGAGTEMLIEKFDGKFNMVHQSVQRLPIGGAPGKDSSILTGVSVRDGVVTSVGHYSPSINIPSATLTERRDAN